MKKMMITLRRPSSDPSSSAFTDQTYVLLDQFLEDFEKMTGTRDISEPYVLLASDFLIATQGQRASWDRLDMAAFEVFAVEMLPPLRDHLLHVATTLGAFYSFLYKRKLVSQRTAVHVHGHMYEHIRRHPESLVS